MPRGRPLKGREQYVRIKLKTNTHLSWTTRKKSLEIKRDGALVCYFLENSVPDKNFNGSSTLGSSESAELPILPSLIPLPKGSPNGNILFSTPIREATVPVKQRSLQALDVSQISSVQGCV